MIRVTLILFCNWISVQFFWLKIHPNKIESLIYILYSIHTLSFVRPLIRILIPIHMFPLTLLLSSLYMISSDNLSVCQFLAPSSILFTAHSPTVDHTWLQQVCQSTANSCWSYPRTLSDYSSCVPRHRHQHRRRRFSGASV